MAIRTDLGDLVISEKNFPNFTEGKKIVETIPSDWSTLPEAQRDLLHVSCNDFNGYAQVVEVNQRNVTLIKTNL